MGHKSTVAFLFFLLPARTALGQGDTVAAEALFQQGRALLDAGKVAEACPKLAESHRLDPATGTLMALALCHEAEGKLASAWAEFTDVEGRARGEGRKDREDLAREHSAALYPRLSQLTIEIPPDVAAIPGLEIKRDGVALGRGAWGTAMPIDGGSHAIQASAPGKVAWTGTVTVRAEGEQARIAVPRLADAAPQPAAAPVAPVASPAAPPIPGPPPPAAAEPKKPWGGLEWAGLGTAAAGVAALGVGGYFLMDALDQKAAADPDCLPDNHCGDDGLKKLDGAVKSGNMATALGIAGGVLAAGGVTLFIVGRSSGGKAEKENVSLSVGVGPFGAALELERRF